MKHVNNSNNKQLDLILRYIPPIYKINGSRPELIGSGILVKKNNNCYLVTTSHIIKEHGENIYIPTNTEYAPSGIATVIKSPNSVIPGSDVDTIDITAIKLENPEPLEQDYTFLSKENIFFHEHSMEDKFMITGYPYRKGKVKSSEKKAQSILLSYLTTPIKFPKDSEKLYFPDVHIPLKIQKRGVNIETKEKILVPEFQGVSGGGSWLIKMENGNPNYYLSGINIEGNRNKSVIYTVKMSVIYEKLD
ncbi:hypothetical protein [Leptospira vanthielii]|uniref:Serine protease n=1 Tax=Leptospira vanthielii TaxID=293085 RepID=A0ABY2NUC0_9LEPT|nr:hypothetical protein [Leptospira vanthielii]TGM61731.1 hypothetical protein EHQ95_00335 [Leptospira vanthielii]